MAGTTALNYWFRGLSYALTAAPGAMQVLWHTRFCSPITPYTDI